MAPFLYLAELRAVTREKLLQNFNLPFAGAGAKMTSMFSKERKMFVFPFVSTQKFAILSGPENNKMPKSIDPVTGKSHHV